MPGLRDIRLLRCKNQTTPCRYREYSLSNHQISCVCSPCLFFSPERDSSHIHVWETPLSPITEEGACPDLNNALFTSSMADNSSTMDLSATKAEERMRHRNEGGVWALGDAGKLSVKAVTDHYELLNQAGENIAIPSWEKLWQCNEKARMQAMKDKRELLPQVADRYIELADQAPTDFSISPLEESKRREIDARAQTSKYSKRRLSNTGSIGSADIRYHATGWTFAMADQHQHQPSRLPPPHPQAPRPRSDNLPSFPPAVLPMNPLKLHPVRYAVNFEPQQQSVTVVKEQSGSEITLPKPVIHQCKASKTRSTLRRECKPRDRRCIGRIGLLSPFRYLHKWWIG